MKSRSIPIAKPAIGNEEIDAVTAVMKSGMLAQGKRVEEFEQLFAAYCGTDHAVAVNSGTAALHATLLAYGLKPGDEVIVPSFTFFATASSVSMCGGRPVFADVDSRTFNLDPEQFLRAITPRTKAVIPVHLFGQPCDIAAISDICTDHGSALIEDAAQAHGALYRGKKTGSFGLAGCFSFYATKNMVTGEGGMITSNDRELVDRVRLVINHGQRQKYLHVCLGYNLRMTDMAAAMGLVQLEKLDRLNRERIRNAAWLTKHLTASGISPPYCAENIQHVYHQYVVKVGEDYSLSRPELIDHLSARGIGTAIHYPIPVHRQPLYGGFVRDTDCPVSTRLGGEVLSLPVHPLLGTEDLEHICNSINEVQ